MNNQQNNIRLFESQEIRTSWDEEAEKWWFSIVDVVATLTESVDAAAYWRKLKQRLKAEGNETVTNCHGLKMRAADGKSRMTDVADTEQLLRIIQSIPSKKAEPFKLWLSEVASQRLDQLQDPELSIEQAMLDYSKRSFKAQIFPKEPNPKLKNYPQICFSIPSASVLQPGKLDAIRRAATHRPGRCTG